MFKAFKTLKLCYCCCELLCLDIISSGALIFTSEVSLNENDIYIVVFILILEYILYFMENVLVRVILN